MHLLFLEVYTARVTLILIDSKPEFIIKFEQDMLQGKSIMQMPKKKKKEKRKNKKAKTISGEHPGLAPLGSICLWRLNPQGYHYR